MPTHVGNRFTADPKRFGFKLNGFQGICLIFAEDEKFTSTASLQKMS